MIKVTTIDNPEYQEFKSWSTFEKTNQVLHSHNDKPSVIYYFENGKVGYKYWHLNDKRHRTGNKSSIIGYFENGEVGYKAWYLDDEEYTKQDYKQIMKQIKAMSDTEKLLDSRQWVREMVK